MVSEYWFAAGATAGNEEPRLTPSRSAIPSRAFVFDRHTRSFPVQHQATMRPGGVQGSIRSSQERSRAVRCEMVRTVRGRLQALLSPAATVGRREVHPPAALRRPLLDAVMRPPECFIFETFRASLQSNDRRAAAAAGAHRGAPRSPRPPGAGNKTTVLAKPSPVGRRSFI